MAQHFFGRAVERARPRPRRAANERRRKRRDGAGRRTRSRPRRSARAPPGSSPRRHPRRCRRWTASAAMRQCRARTRSASGDTAGMPRILILGGTTEARAAGRTARQARRSRRHAVARRPHRRAGSARRAGSRRRLWRRRRAWPIISSTQRIDALIDATHPYATVISANAAAAARRTGVPFMALRRPPWIAVAGDRWIEVDDAARGGERHRREQPAASLSRSAATSLRRSPARRSIVISSAASIRSIRRCRCRT